MGMKRRDFLRTVGTQAAVFSALPFTLSTRAALSQNPGVTADLVPLFTQLLQDCKVKSGETVLFHAPPNYPHPEYIGPMLAAAGSLDAHAFALTGVVGGADATGSVASGARQSRLLADAYKAADLVIGSISLYTEMHNEALASGTRTLQFISPVDQLRRMYPDPVVMKRVYAGAERMWQAREIRVTDDAGSDFVMNKTGRKGHGQVGLSNKPGRWDSNASGLVACAPLEDSAEGVYVLQPGDCLLGLGRYVQGNVRVTLRQGRITQIEGGYDARMIRDRLDRFKDVKDPQGRLSDPYRVAHAGWGCDPRAEWHLATKPGMGHNAESLYGVVMVSLGRNMFDSNDRFSGLGGKNYTPVHFDICCRSKQLYLDGELIVDNDKIVVPELA